MREVNSAKTELKVQAYSFTSPSIAEAIARAYARGVRTTVILDDSNDTAKYTGATYLVNHGVPTFIDAKHAIAHNKIMIIDGTTVITGSFNFTEAAEKSNAENLLILHRPDVAQKYLANFDVHLKHSEPYKR